MLRYGSQIQALHSGFASKLVGWPWRSHLTSLSFSSPKCKMVIRIAPTSFCPNERQLRKSIKITQHTSISHCKQWMADVVVIPKYLKKWIVHPAEPMFCWRTEFSELRCVQISWSLTFGRDKCQSPRPLLVVRMDLAWTLQNIHLTGGLWRNQKFSWYVRYLIGINYCC